MAEAAASALVKVIFDKLADEAFKKYVRSQGIHDELNNLGAELSQIQALLNDASDKEVKDEAVKKWLNDLQHLAYDIDDVIDVVATEAMLESGDGTSSSKVRKFIIPTCCTNFSLTHRLSRKLDGITAELNRLYKARSDLGLVVKDERQQDPNRGNESSLLEPDVVGREGEKKKLLNKLLGDDDEYSKENYIIVPIVGMGGIGKTTLARILYNDTKVKGCFELKAWVCVSDEFDIFKISETIYQAVATENKQFKDVNQLQVALGEQLKGKRFLVVLDDVWTENYNDWEKLARPFHSAAPGSKVIITTRKEQLLQKLGFNQLDQLEGLSYEDALSLFALHALGVDNFDLHAKLKPIGEGIVKKCNGLPLALKAIGRLLRTKTDGEEWDAVLNSEIWDLENANEIVPALRLSYHDLSADLKRLFAYCSLFPKDYLFDKEELVLLWMAEGYLSESSANKSPELLGHECFEKLLSRSFFQHAPNDESLFVMHDLMNDVATFVAREYFLRFDNQMEMAGEALAKYRHMSFVHEEYVAYQKFTTFQEAKRLRTLIAMDVGVETSWRGFYLSGNILVDLLPRLPLLRVLRLSGFKIREVPELIGNLKHLRYLNLSRTGIKKLPENVGNLYNLQTLLVSSCRRLTKLPTSFLKLKKLRHFDISNTPLLKKLPLGIGELRSLHTLTKIIIGGDDAGLAINELKGLKSLHGKISIEGLHRVESATHAREANLSLKKITELEIKWVDVFNDSRNSTLEKEVLNELKPNSDNLKELVVVSYGGHSFSNWVGDRHFHELVNVSIRDCRKCSSLPPFGQLPSLKELLIQGMGEVKNIGLELFGSDVVAFPSLELLTFEDMSSWKEWLSKSEGLDAVFPCLRELQTINCPNLINISLEALPSLRVLKIEYCGDSVLISLVQAASSITKLKIASILGLTDLVWRGVIKYPRALEELYIERCNEIKYLWESEAEASKVLVNLKKLVVWGCDKLVSLGEKDEEEEDNFGSNLLSSLKTLVVRICYSMERCCCPNSISIESLEVSYCKSLTRVSFPTTAATGGGGGGGQKLKSFEIFNCGEVMELINKTGISMPILEVLQISNWRNLNSITQLSNFIHLTQLSINNCPGIESLPDLHPSMLTNLYVEGCESLKTLPDLSNLTLLKDLTIKNCPSIDTSFPGGVWPPKLCSLSIGRLKKPISEWGDQKFPTTLVHLHLINEPQSHVSNFSQLSPLLPCSLTKLCIEEFDELESLSMGLDHLTSLQHLTIWDCPEMKHLPKTLLPSLLCLWIEDCPILEERCKGRGSHYWPLISHIPKIEIDGRDAHEECENRERSRLLSILNKSVVKLCV